MSFLPHAEHILLFCVHKVTTFRHVNCVNSPTHSSKWNYPPLKIVPACIFSQLMNKTQFKLRWIASKTIAFDIDVVFKRAVRSVQSRNDLFSNQTKSKSRIYFLLKQKVCIVFLILVTNEAKFIRQSGIV